MYFYEETLNSVKGLLKLLILVFFFHSRDLQIEHYEFVLTLR